MFGIIGLKECVGGMEGATAKALGSTEELLGKPSFLRPVGVPGTLGGAVKRVDIQGNADGESGVLGWL